MKANELEKKYIPLETIYELVKKANEQGEYKTFIFPHKRIKEETIMQLITDGFKVYKGDYDNIDLYLTNVMIIEWE